MGFLLTRIFHFEPDIAAGIILIDSCSSGLAGNVMVYLASRFFKLDKNSARTIALEAGLQNGGMVSGIAGSMGKPGTVAPAPAVFSPWMNISGSIVANY